MYSVYEANRVRLDVIDVGHTLALEIGAVRRSTPKAFTIYAAIKAKGYI